jgi:hypothetical protein
MEVLAFVVFVIRYVLSETFAYRWLNLNAKVLNRRVSITGIGSIVAYAPVMEYVIDMIPISMMCVELADIEILSTGEIDTKYSQHEVSGYLAFVLPWEVDGKYPLIINSDKIKSLKESIKISLIAHELFHIYQLVNGRAWDGRNIPYDHRIQEYEAYYAQYVVAGSKNLKRKYKEYIGDILDRL